MARGRRDLCIYVGVEESVCLILPEVYIQKLCQMKNEKNSDLKLSFVMLSSIGASDCLSNEESLLCSYTYNAWNCRMFNSKKIFRGLPAEKE